MDSPLISVLVTTALVVLTVAAARWYFHHVRVERPPVGVFNLRDVVFSFVVLVVVPPLYLRLPRQLIGTILVLFGIALLYIMLTPLVRRPAAMAVALTLAGGEVALELTGRSGSALFVGLNDLVLLLLVVGVCNTWAQSGIRARDTAVFAGAVMLYDVVATGLLPTTLEFATRLQSLPFAPTMGWGSGTAAVFTGLGDLLFIVLWPLVAEKAYSVAAGRAAMAVTLGCVGTITALFQFQILTTPIPGMVLMGPAVIVHYLFLRHRHRQEHTAGEYEVLRHPELPPLVVPPPRPVADLAVAVDWADRCATGGTGRYRAIVDGEVLASGTNPGAVLRAAGRRNASATPVLVLGPPGPDDLA
ncbi:MAG: hypothetical protein WCA46_08455 [Actinocatenispora sp.]